MVPASGCHYATAFPNATGITYDGSGNVATVTENGVTTTYTYGPNGVATDQRTVGGITTTEPTPTTDQAT